LKKSKNEQERLKILEKIAYLCKITIPYVTGTINLTVKVKDNKDWIMIHAGRTYSLLKQLKNIKKLVDSIDIDEKR